MQYQQAFLAAMAKQQEEKTQKLQEQRHMQAIMEAASAQATKAKESLDNDLDTYHWHRRMARGGVPPSDKSSDICGDFKRGDCSRGRFCKYSHDLGPDDRGKDR